MGTRRKWERRKWERRKRERRKWERRKWERRKWGRRKWGRRKWERTQVGTEQVGTMRKWGRGGWRARAQVGKKRTDGSACATVSVASKTNGWRSRPTKSALEAKQPLRGTLRVP